MVFPHFSNSNVRMSEGTFCHVEVHLCVLEDLNVFIIWSDAEEETVKQEENH